MEQKLQQAIHSGSTAEVHKVFEQIYYRYGRLVGYVISKYVFAQDDVEELIDDVFVSFSHAMFVTEIRNIKSHLVSCAKNAAINFVKRTSGRQIAYLEELSPSEKPSVPMYCGFWELADFLQSILSAHEAEVVLQHVVFGYTFPELALRYNAKPSTIKSLCNRALKKCKKEMVI